MPDEIKNRENTSEPCELLKTTRAKICKLLRNMQRIDFRSHHEAPRQLSSYRSSRISKDSINEFSDQVCILDIKHGVKSVTQGC